jgi:hypothetical protein
MSSIWGADGENDGARDGDNGGGGGGDSARLDRNSIHRTMWSHLDMTLKSGFMRNLRTRIQRICN